MANPWDDPNWTGLQLSGINGQGMPPSVMPNPGAQTPGSPSGQQLMPGGGVMNYSASTPGAPSMGYPATGGANLALLRNLPSQLGFSVSRNQSSPLKPWDKPYQETPPINFPAAVNNAFQGGPKPPQFTAQAPPAQAPPAQAPPAQGPAQAPAGGGGGQASPYGSPWDPQGAGYAAAQRLQNPWDPQGQGWLATQRLAQQQAPSVQGPMAALAQPGGSPFGMVLRPNADPTNTRGGTPLGTALDLSSIFNHPAVAAAAAQHPAVQAAGAAQAAAAPPVRVSPKARAQADPTNFAGLGPYRDAPANRAPIGQPIKNTWAPGASGIVQGPGGMEMLNPGKPMKWW